MKVPANSLLSRAHALLKHQPGRTALKLSPLAALGLMAQPAVARPLTVIFDPADATSNGDNNNNFFQDSGGGFTGSAQSNGANGSTGVTYSGNQNYIDGQFEGGYAGQVGSINMFSVTGTGSGALSTAADMASIRYDFTLGTTAGTNNGDPVTITGWTLDLSVTTSAGTTGQTVSSTGGAGTYGDTVQFALDGADAGATLTGYSGSLTVNYEFAGSDNVDNGGSVSVTVPAGQSIDFNAVGAVPEPSTWVILATGVIGTGFQLMRVRQRRARTAPAA